MYSGKDVRVCSQMLQLKARVELGQRNKKVGFARASAQVLDRVPRSFRVPQPVFHVRHAIHRFRMQQALHGAAIGVPAHYNVADSQPHTAYSILADTASGAPCAGTMFPAFLHTNKSPGPV